MPRPRQLFLFACALAACAQAACTAAPDRAPLRAGWRPVLENPEVRASVNTTTIVRSLYGTDLSLGFDYARPDPVPGDTTGQTFSRSEARVRVDCGRRRARSVHLRILDRDGGRQLMESGFAEDRPEGAWHAFASHPLGEAIFDSLCVALPTLPARDA